MRRPAAGSLAAPSQAPRGNLSQIRLAMPSRIPRSTLPFLWPMHFSASSRYALSPSFAYGFKLKRAPLWHNLIQASRRRAIVTYHRADGRHLIKIHPADGRSSIIAPTGNHRYSQRRRASTATTPTGAIYFKNFASPSSAWAIPASCCTLPFASRTKTIRCLSASLHLIVASCAKSPHNHTIGHCRHHSIISLAIAAPSPIHLGHFL